MYGKFPLGPSMARSGTRMNPEVVALQKIESPGKDFCELKWQSAVMCELDACIRRVAPTSATVMITGESGSGKEVVARRIHELSPRAGRPFVAVNCGAISPQLIASELFGHERGSFTGAIREHRGHFECADGGTLFLDEITEMPLEQQVALLRVLESGRFMRVGSQSELRSDIRVLAATNRDPEEAVKEGDLREDLFYRLQVFSLRLPPLRERKEDIPLLAQHFIRELNREERACKQLSRQALQALQNYHWPGNVRQLKHSLQRAFIMSGDEIRRESLAPEILAPAPVSGPYISIRVGSSLAEAERQLILATLRQCGGSKEMTARILGVSLKTLYNRVKKYTRDGDIEDPRDCFDH